LACHESWFRVKAVREQLFEAAGLERAGPSSPRELKV
jgi:hypothetical protein